MGMGISAFNLWGGGDTFQSSSYHSFPLKPGRVKNTPPPIKNLVSLSQFLIELHSFAQSRWGQICYCFLVCLFSIYMQKPGIVVFRKLQSNAFVRLQTIFKKTLLQEEECLESYESIALKLAEDDYTWFRKFKIYKKYVQILILAL